MQDDLKSLSHSKWRCKYHIVFAPKYRRQIVYGKIKADVGKILRELSERKGGGDTGGGMLSGSYPHACGNPAAPECSSVYGIPQE